MTGQPKEVCHRVCPQPVVGVYPFGQPGEPVELHRGGVVVDGTSVGEGCVVMTLDCDLDVRWETTTPAHLKLGATMLALDRPELGGVEMDVRVSNSGGRGYVPSADLGGRDPLDRVVVHWVNLPWIMPAGALETCGADWLGRWECEEAGWSLTLDSRPDLAVVLNDLAETRKFVITHVGELRRADRSAFTAGEASEVLFHLQLALSFALGRWVPPALPVGFDAAGRRVWEQWAPWRCDTYGGYESWWDTHTGDDLQRVVAAFLDACADATRGEVVRHVAQHVIAANHRGTSLEARIMVMHAAFEYLAWVNYVLAGRRSRRQHKQLHAAEVVRELLVDAGIPVAVPDDLVALRRYAGERDVDGPGAITGVRNTLVHPKDAGEPYRIERLLVEAWQLSMTYGELLLLERLGYQGPYLPRFPPGRWAHSSESVPWAANDEQSLSLPEA